MAVSPKAQPGRFEVLFKVEQEGYFMGSIKHNGNALDNGHFSVLSINSEMALDG